MPPERDNDPDFHINDDSMGWYYDNKDTISPIRTTGPIEWPNSVRSQSFSLNINEKSAKCKKYEFIDDKTFQLALNYFNKRWEKPVRRSKKVGRREDQDIYVEKINCFNANATKIIECRRCKHEVNGLRYYMNENNTKDVLCKGCMGRKLKKEVGTDARRLEEELQWLEEKDLEKLSSNCKFFL